MIRCVNGAGKRLAVLALAAWWGVSLTFAPLLHRHTAEPLGGECGGPICRGLPDSSPSSSACHVAFAHAKRSGRLMSAGTSDAKGPGSYSGVSSRGHFDTAHCPVCHFLTQGQDRAPAGCWVHREALIGWTLVLDDAPGVPSLRLSHYGRGPPVEA